MSGVVAFMIGVAAASPSLYRTFCSLTGFGGTPLRAEVAPGAIAHGLAIGNGRGPLNHFWQTTARVEAAR